MKGLSFWLRLGPEGPALTRNGKFRAAAQYWAPTLLFPDRCLDTIQDPPPYESVLQDHDANNFFAPVTAVNKEFEIEVGYEAVPHFSFPSVVTCKRAGCRVRQTKRRD